MVNPLPRSRRWARLAGAAVLCCSLAAVSFLQLNPGTAQAESAISQGFNLRGAVSDGALVSVEKNKSDTVALATAQSAERIIGVIGTQPLVELSESASRASVIIDGTALVLVSDINGALDIGDKVAVSPIDGVGMKATTSSQVVGVAQAHFADIETQARTIKDQNGNDHTVHIGRMPVQVGVTYYTAPNNSVLPPFMQNLANAIAGKPVSLVRIFIAASLTLIAAISVFALMYSSTRSGIASIGRNPLAAGAIRKGLLQVGGYSLLIFSFSLVASYIIIRT